MLRNMSKDCNIFLSVSSIMKILFMLSLSPFNFQRSCFICVNAATDPSTVSVGKLRSDADAAMVGGDVDKSIKLMNLVN